MSAGIIRCLLRFVEFFLENHLKIRLESFGITALRFSAKFAAIFRIFLRNRPRIRLETKTQNRAIFRGRNPFPTVKICGRKLKKKRGTFLWYFLEQKVVFSGQKLRFRGRKLRFRGKKRSGVSGHEKSIPD